MFDVKKTKKESEIQYTENAVKVRKKEVVRRGNLWNCQFPKREATF